MPDIRPELVEKATRLIDWGKHEFRVTGPAMVPYCTCGWRSEAAYDVAAYDRHITGVVLATVADDLRAEGAAKALREAAEAFGENQMIREGDVKEWLRARAEHAARCPHPKCPGGSLCCCCADALKEK